MTAQTEKIARTARTPAARLAIAGFEPAPDGPRRARRFVTEVLRERGDTDLIEDATMIVSEMATNAVVHARSRFQVAVHFQRGTVTLSVSDTSPALPAARRPAPSDANCHGLQVVGALARDWGYSPARAGKSAWAELAR
jgi:hypothetical protein